MSEEFVWVEKYRPKKISDCILPTNIKKTFQDFLDKGEVPNLLLAGPPGCGKTTVAKALCEELGADYYVINGSDEGRFLETVRVNAKNFASTLSLQASAKHKVVIIDEADNTTPDVQLCLRAFTEEFIGNCRFIFTCNYKNKIISPLHSRCAVIDFSIKGKDRQELAAAFFARIKEILVLEKVESEPKVLAELINKHFPDWRRVLNELQRYSAGGKIDSGILAAFTNVQTNELFRSLKTKDFSKVRKWVVDNLDNDPVVLLRSIYDGCYTSMEGAGIAGIAAAVLINIANCISISLPLLLMLLQEINIHKCLACLT